MPHNPPCAAKVTKSQRGRGEGGTEGKAGASEEVLSFQKALVYCCRACIYFMPPQTVAKGRAWSLAVIREVGRECALRHREQLCSDTLSPREPSEELAIGSFRTHAHTHTGRFSTETCPLQANLPDQAPEVQKLNSTRTTLTCAFLLFFFFFSHIHHPFTCRPWRSLGFWLH